MDETDKHDQADDANQILSGLLYVKNKEYEKAKLCFEKAIQQNPNDISAHLNLSNVYIALNDHEKAKQHLHQALRLDPHHAESYNNLGRLFYKENLLSDAIPFFEKALRINPDYWEAHYNLAHSLTKKNQASQAMVHYQEALRLKPDHAFAHYNLGLLLFEMQSYEPAETHLKQAIELGLKEPMALYYLAHSLLALGKVEQAKQWFEEVIKAIPIQSEIHGEMQRETQRETPEKTQNETPKSNVNNKAENKQQETNQFLEILAQSHHNLAVLNLRTNQKSQALNHFEQTLALNPNNETAQHMIEALKGIQSNNKTKAPNAYISELFDQYADYYDEHLKLDLKYAVPGRLRNAVGRCLGKELKPGRVLDLGCGTGLCGIYFRDLALTLIGIDLSPKMVEKAKSLGAYDEVVCGDFNEYLLSETHTILLSQFDLILAADVLVYLGDLKESFQNIAKALNNNGLFAFTIELDETSDFSSIKSINSINKLNTQEFIDKTKSLPHYFLQLTGRYTHTVSYIHELASENHLSIEVEDSIVLRKNQDKEILGILFVLRKVGNLEI